MLANVLNNPRKYHANLALRHRKHIANVTNLRCLWTTDPVVRKLINPGPEKLEKKPEHLKLVYATVGLRGNWTTLRNTYSYIIEIYHFDWLPSLLLDPNTTFRSYIESLFGPIHMQSWSKFKLGQVGVGANIAQNHSSVLKEASDHYWPTSHANLTKGEFKSSWNRLEHCSESVAWPLGSHIWSLFAPMYMVNWPKLKLRSSWSRLKHCSESLVYAIGSHIWSLAAQFT